MAIRPVRGAPVLGTALAGGLAFGWPACLAGVLLASFASFVLFIPMAALWLTGGRPLASGTEPPMLPDALQRGLLALWAATAWTVAWIAAG